MMKTTTSDEEDEGERERIDELRTAIADSLFATAVTAAAAGQWFLDQHEQWEDEVPYGAEPPATGQTSSEDTADAEDDVLTDCVLEHKLQEELLLCEPDDLSDWNSYERWSYRESSASTSRRNHSRLSIADLRHAERLRKASAALTHAPKLIPHQRRRHQHRGCELVCIQLRRRIAAKSARWVPDWSSSTAASSRIVSSRQWTTSSPAISPRPQ